MLAPDQESMAVLLLPGRLEYFEREAHARSLLSIPRVVALEASLRRPPRLLREAAPLRQARRLRLPGALRVVVLYHPEQYPLARALCGEHPEAELWYLPPNELLATADPARTQDLLAADELARQRAHRLLTVTGAEVDEAPLRLRLRELGVISPRAFVPEGHFARRRRS
jgi:hypothetical protein